jgi:hypothetical protein
MKNQNLLDFNRVWEISDKMIYKDAAWQQNNFIRDVVCRGLLGAIPFKVSEHRSKSIKLPVYGFVMDNGIVIVARENFYGWKLSVKTPRPLPVGYLPTDILEGGVYDENREDNNKIYSCYLEGFKEEWAYDAYNPKDDKQTEFTIGVYDDYNFYMLMYLLNKAFSPMAFNASDDKRSVSEIAESISEIKNCQPNMDSWEVFPLTRRLVECDVDDYDDAKRYAELIVGNSKAHEVFLMEEYMYNFKF